MSAIASYHCHPEWPRAVARSKWKKPRSFAVILSEAKDPTGLSETDRPANCGVLQPLRGFRMTVHGAYFLGAKRGPHSSTRKNRAAAFTVGSFGLTASG
jgi:hypothetical protein